MMEAKTLLDVFESTREFGTHMYALLDGARSPWVFSGLSESSASYCCLFKGDLSPELEEAAPYLVDLESDTKFRDWLLAKGWNDSWGIYFASPSGMEELQKHFRHFTEVKSEDGEKMFFRFYDPRVWRVYLPTCNHEELAYVFGPIDSYWVEAGNDSDLLQFKRAGDGSLQADTHAVGKEPV